MKYLFLFFALTFSTICFSQNPNSFDASKNMNTLTEQEKLKIQLEENYRNEITSNLTNKKKIDWIETVTKIGQGLAIIIGIIVTISQFKKQTEDKRQQERDRLEQTAKEYRKYFYQKQFEFYSEAVEATAILSTEELYSEDYNKARKLFFRLFWGRLSMVEEKSVENDMMDFKKLLIEYEKPNSAITIDQLQQASLCLAHDASWYTINIWLDNNEIKNYNDRRCPR
jgi:hypothetical protein